MMEPHWLWPMTRQMASTPKRWRCSSTKRIIASWGWGRVPLRKSRGSSADLVGASGFGQFAMKAPVLLLKRLATGDHFFGAAVVSARELQGLWT